MDVTIVCVCPGDDVRHPEGDHVVLRDKLNYIQATTITKAVALLDTPDDEAVKAAMILATMSEFYLIVGVESWTLADEKGKPVDLTPGNIRAFLNRLDDATSAVVEAAEGLYREVILLPLLRRASNISAPSSTNSSTSRKPNGGRRKSPTPLKRSSTSTIPTAATEMTSSSLDGDSSFSQSGITAA